ncbi:MAG: FAD-binding protein [Tepidisphaeraceae bacterium]
MQNWSGNYTYTAARVDAPRSVDELTTIVKKESRVKALGTRHCFNAIADTPGVQISTLNLDKVLAVDVSRRQVTVEGGITYGQLNPVLHTAGLALPNLASLPHVTIAGACATATHGSGETLGCLSTHVAEMDFVTADGSLKTVKRGNADFAGCVVHLGRLGIVTRLVLDCVPTFEMKQTVIRRVPMAAYVQHVNDIAASVYSVSLFTTWQTEAFDQVWLKAVADQPSLDLTTLGGTPATGPVHPIENVPGAPGFSCYDPAASTEQGGVAGPAYLRLTHFKLEHTPSSGNEIQSEFFIAREHFAAGVEAISKLRDDIRPVIQVSEIRLVAADELWMSPFYRRPSVGFHFTWRKDPAGVLAVAKKIEAALKPFDPRPHWGKVSTIGETAETKYPMKAAFDDLVKRWDPHGKFAPLPNASTAV